MFTTLIVQPLFNILVAIYALLPGHDFGLSIIIFTVLVRLLMWPLVKKQLHHTRAMREIQPELKRIKEASKGDRQKESMMMMELYKEREVNPFAPIGLLLVQLPVLIALYSGLSRIIHDPQSIVNFSYPFIQKLPWIKTLAADIGNFHPSLLGIVDLNRTAVPRGGGAIYWPAMLVVLASAVAQYFQSAQVLMDDKKAKGLRQILKEAGTGKQADSTEVNAAVGRGTRFMVPAMVLLFTISMPAALPLYWLVTGLAAVYQQGKVLAKDKTEMETLAEDKTTGKAIEGEIISRSPKGKDSQTRSKSKQSKKRRKR